MVPLTFAFLFLIFLKIEELKVDLIKLNNKKSSYVFSFKLFYTGLRSTLYGHRWKAFVGRRCCAI
jgi:hypothetical protein